MSTTPLTIADAIPMVCTIDDVCRVLNISRPQFFTLRREGTFPIPELLPRLDSRPRFSGADLQRYLNGELAQRRSA